MIKIKTERLIIYPATDDEMKNLISQQTIPELKSAYEEMLDGCLSHPEKRQWYAIWNMVLLNDSETVVGNLSFKGLEADGILEIGYGMNEDFEGQGYMTEAVRAVVSWAMKQDGVKSIEAEIENSNIASKKVLEKSGFVFNGKFGSEGPRFVLKNL